MRNTARQQSSFANMLWLRDCPRKHLNHDTSMIHILYSEPNGKYMVVPQTLGTTRRHTAPAPHDTSCC